MKKKSSISFIIAAFIFLLNNFLATICCSQSSQKAFESYYLRSTNYPSFDNLWTVNYPVDFHLGTGFRKNLADGESQGVTHDNNNWYFTWTNDKIGYMFKVPVDLKIEDNVFLNPRVASVEMTSFQVLDTGKYWHWGDPDHYTNTDGVEYIVVPITSAKNNKQNDYPPIIAIFRASNLRLVAYAYLKLENRDWCDNSLKPQRSVGWCAVHPITGELYTSEDFDYTACLPYTCDGGVNFGKSCKINNDCPNSTCVQKSDCDDQRYRFTYRRELLHYGIPWDSVTGNTSPKKLTLDAINTLTLKNANGSPLEIYNMQGGEFTSTGELLYTSSGSGCCYALGFGGGFGQQYALDGLNVFDTKTWKVIKRSYNHDDDFPLKNLPKYFDYHYPLGCDGAGSWSPEGLTIWDLDNGRAPGINGQLHVLLFKFRATGSNRQVFEHFGNRIYVDPVNGIDQPIPNNLADDDALPGAKPIQFKTFKYAYNSYPAWDGSEIVLKAGKYPGVGKYSTRIRIVSRGGSAIIR